MIKDILYEIKWAYQRVVRGFDDRIYWEFDSYFAQFIKPLEKFCTERLLETEAMRLNPHLKEVYTKTLRLIKEYRNMSYEESFKNINAETRLWSYFGAKIHYYWD